MYTHPWAETGSKYSEIHQPSKGSSSVRARAATATGFFPSSLIRSCHYLVTLSCAKSHSSTYTNKLSRLQLEREPSRAEGAQMRWPIIHACVCVCVCVRACVRACVRETEIYIIWYVQRGTHIQYQPKKRRRFPV